MGKDIDMNVHLGEERKQWFKTACELHHIPPSRWIKNQIDAWREKLKEEK